MPLNAGHRYREEVESDAASLLDYLSRAHPHSSRSEWLARLERGEVAMNGRVVHTDLPVLARQQVTWDRPPWNEPEVPLHFGIVHEDESLLVVNKPSGLPTLPAGGFLTHTLLALLRARDRDWSPLHRLGRGTSGLVVCCRAPAARARLQAAFASRSLEKRYLALAQGQVPAPQAVSQPIGPVPHAKLGMIHAASATGKRAETLILSSQPRGGHSLAELQLVTGRPHQIRIHLAAIGHPLVGDPLYIAGGVPGSDALPGDLGYQLHAWRIRFDHPVTGQRVSFEAPVPPGLT